MNNHFHKLFGDRTFFIAEIGGNFSDYDTGVRLIDLAVRAGADGVKIQTYKASTLSSRKAMFSSDGMIFTGDVSQYESFEKYQIDDDVQKRLFEYAQSNNVLMLSTPSHYSDCIVLERLNCPIYKIGSDDVTNIPFLKQVASIGKPVILSTGMSTLVEVKEAVDAILSMGNNDICVLHCVTNYPADYESANLLSIRSMIDAFKPIPIGFSDHSPYDELVLAAVALGAKVIEKHFTYDKNADGPDHPISLLPQEFKRMVEKVRNIEIALGDGIKRPARAEATTRQNNRKSIVMTRSLRQGEIITEESFAIKRPGFGIEPKYAPVLIGRILARDIEEDDVLLWDHLVKLKILVRADGNYERGLGHISKQITLSNKLKRTGNEILFVTRRNEVAASLLHQAGFQCIQMEGEVLAPIDEIIASYRPELIILDILDTTADYVHGLKKRKVKVITFDNTDPSALDCDAVFNVMYYHKEETRKLLRGAAVYEGYKYIIIDEAYCSVGESKNVSVQGILLTQGGADTGNRTPFLMETLVMLKEETKIPFHVDVVVGPAFDRGNIARIEQVASMQPMFNVRREPANLADLIGRCDIAITAGGTTMWELAACKRPMYVFINESFEDETARVVDSLGFALYDGYLPEREKVLDSLKKLVEDFSLRRKFVYNMERYDIGSGLNRVVDGIYKHGVLI